MSKIGQISFDELGTMTSQSSSGVQLRSAGPGALHVHPGDVSMLCTKGSELIRGYREATKQRAEARDRLLLFPAEANSGVDPLFLAKQQYSQAFVAWVSHRSFCSSCRTFYGTDDRTQFVSL